MAAGATVSPEGAGSRDSRAELILIATQLVEEAPKKRRFFLSLSFITLHSIKYTWSFLMSTELEDGVFSLIASSIWDAGMYISGPIVFAS